MAPRSSIAVIAALQPKKRGSLEDELLSLAGQTYAHFFWPSSPPPLLGEPFLRAGAQLALLGSPLAFARRLRQMGARLAHFHFFRPHDPAVLAARAAGCRIVLTDHVALLPTRRTPLRRAYRVLRGRTLGRTVDLRLCVSQFVARSVQATDGVSPERLRVLPNGIDLGRFMPPTPSVRQAARRALGLSPQTQAIVCVARCAAEKGVETLIRAVAALPTEVVVLVAGDGRLQPGYEALARALGCGPRLRFLGLRNDTERLLAAADVAVVPSHAQEACPLAVQEAMAAGLPLVATATGGTPELAVHNVHALLVPPRDASALGRSLRDVLRSPELRQRLGHAAHARARERFGMDIWLSRLLSIYDEIAPGIVDRAPVLRAA